MLGAIHYSVLPRLGDQKARNALCAGIRLAGCIDCLNANLAWEKPVRGYFASRRKSKYRALVQAKAEELRQRGVTRGLKAEVARALQLEGIEISPRQVYELIK